jgi:predicted  nucleic acid-binding Zn-ribbon protein
MNIAQLNKLLKEVKVRQKKIQKEKDRLWDIHSELNDFLNDMDEGCEELTEGVSLLGQALDTLSQKI